MSKLPDTIHPGMYLQSYKLEYRKPTVTFNLRNSLGLGTRDEGMDWEPNSILKHWKGLKVDYEDYFDENLILPMELAL